MDTKTIEISLLHNLLDYMIQSAYHAQKDSSGDWKYSLLNMVSAIELLLKVRLQDEHWSLIFSDVEKASKIALKSGDFVSVDFKSAINRIQNIANIDIDKETYRKLEELRRYRNRVQHYAISVEKATLVSLIAFGFNFSINFIRKEINTDNDEGINTVLEKIIGFLSNFNEFVITRLEEIKEQLDRASKLLECPRCWQETLQLGEESPICNFCGFNPSIFDLAYELNYSIADDECPACGISSLVILEDSAYLCLSCGDENEYERCLRCEQLVSGELNPGDQCDNCWECILEKND